MNDTYKKAKDLFEKELDKIVAKDNLSPAELEVSFKLVDILKDIAEICEKDGDPYMDSSSEARYSMRMSRNYHPYMGGGEYYVNGTYGRGGYGSYDGYPSDYGMQPSRNNNMNANAKLQQMYDEAGSDHERRIIQSLMNKMMN